MGEEIALNLSAFQNKLSATSFACFRLLLDKARESIAQDGPLKAYELPLPLLLELKGTDDIEAVAQTIRDILECMVEMKKGDYLYFFPIFSSISIEKGVVRYSLPAEIERAIPTVSFP